MDEKYLEVADALTSSIIEAGIKKARLQKERPKEFEGDCTCGTVIQPARVNAGYYNCVPCQERIESRGKFYRGNE